MATLIRNATVVDGTGDRSYTADVLISGSNIMKVSKNIPAEQYYKVIDANGLVLTPGFINTHSHFELEIFKHPDLLPSIGQGITTEVLGQDGSSVVPVSDEILNELMENMAPLCGTIDRPYWWRSYADFDAEVSKMDCSVRYVSLIGHGTIRMNVIGNDNRKATPEEILKMQDVLAKCMEEGAKGLSFGLIYPPCSYADTEEITQLCKTVAKYDGIVMVHMRNEMDHILEAFEEMVTAMKGSGVRLQISHLKSLGPSNWGTVLKILDRMEELHKEGYNITFDQYPWDAGSTGLKATVPDWAYSGGIDCFEKRLENSQEYDKILEGTKKILTQRGKGKRILIANTFSKEFSWIVGKKLDEIAEKLGMEEAEAVLYLLKHERSQVVAIYLSISEDDLQAVMKSPYQCLCTDGIIGAAPHPRVFSSYPRFLGHYVRDLKLMSLETAIHRITMVPAARLRLWDRGIIREGMSADLVLFDYNEIIDTNSYSNPKVMPKGIKRVWVQGKIRFENV